MPFETFAIAIVAGARSEGPQPPHSIDSLLPQLQRHGGRVEWIARSDDPASHARLINDKSAIVYVVEPEALDSGSGHAITRATMVRTVRAQSEEIPFFLYGEGLTARGVPTEVLREIEGVINAYEDTPEFVARNILREANRYVERLARPFSAR